MTSANKISRGINTQRYTANYTRSRASIVAVAFCLFVVVVVVVVLLLFVLVLEIFCFSLPALLSPHRRLVFQTFAENKPNSFRLSASLCLCERHKMLYFLPDQSMRVHYHSAADPHCAKWQCDRLDLIAYIRWQPGRQGKGREQQF